MSEFDAKTERWLVQSVVDHLASSAEMAGVYIEFPGMETNDSEDIEEWVRFFLLDGVRDVARRTEFRGRPIWQASCISKTAERRTDENNDAPWHLAGRVRKAMEGPIEITKIGEVSEDSIGYLSMNEGSSVYFDRLPDRSDAHMVVVTFTSSHNLPEE